MLHQGIAGVSHKPAASRNVQMDVTPEGGQSEDALVTPTTRSKRRGHNSHFVVHNKHEIEAGEALSTVPSLKVFESLDIDEGAVYRAQDIGHTLACFKPLRYCCPLADRLREFYGVTIV